MEEHEERGLKERIKRREYKNIRSLAEVGRPMHGSSCELNPAVHHHP